MSPDEIDSNLRARIELFHVHSLDDQGEALLLKFLVSLTCIILQDGA